MAAVSAGGPSAEGGTSGAGDYYSLDAVLAEETAVPCTFGVACSGVGRALDPSAGLEDVQTGANVELPLWLLPPLAQRGMLNVRMPKWYGERMRRKVQAGAGCEDLRRRCPYFYDVAMRLHSLGAPPAVGEFTNATFRARYRELLTKAQSGESAAELARIEGLLSAEEASLFRQARDAQEAFDRWRFGGRAPARAGSLKRRLDGAAANGGH